MGQLWPLFLFRSFQTNIITILTTNTREKCPSSIRCWDSNPQTLESESLPITTSPGLPPYIESFTSLNPTLSGKDRAFGKYEFLK